VSSDGRITSWTLRYAELQYHDVIKLVGEDSNSDEKASDVAIEAPPSAGTCFAFNKASEHLFLVGTEEGKVHKCSKAYSSKFLATFDAHQMVVYSVVWNKFHSQVFATCSADWSLKIWDHSYPKPLFQFDLGNPVGDVAWAPFSSTVFAAVTTDSRVHIFDLSKSKYEPICVQPIMKKGRLTHVEFNPIHPIIIVGDDRGSTYSLKLSPNLRKELSKKGGVVADAQVEKFQKLIDSVKELNIQTGEVIGEI
jgi:dynein intermediate chain 1